MSRKPRLLVIGTPGYNTGGNLRCLRSLQEYSKHFDTYLLIPVNHVRYLLQTGLFTHLTNYHVKLAGFFYNSLTTRAREFENFITNYIVSPLVPKIYSTRFLDLQDFDAIFVEHENLDFVIMATSLSKEKGAPTGVLLQNPPFLGDKRRVKNVLRAHLLWRKMTAETSIETLLSQLKITYRILSWHNILRKAYEYILKKYDLVVGVSKATIFEMGEEYLQRYKFLDPGVALDNEDISMLQMIKGKTTHKKDIILYKGGPVVEKGILEALLAFKLITKEKHGLKLYISGSLNPYMLEKTKKLTQKLGISDRVVLTGFLDRPNIFILTAQARLVLHPSHFDAFSYAVAESLSLGTPVTAYNIPALNLYYSNNKGIFLVEEGDIEALAYKSIEVLEQQNIEVDTPRLKTWEEIMREEVNLIKKLFID
jgi:glycosyltransferase involved in cell wall biosynthesis